jgi:SAM-dependent methyltransferase
MEAGLSTAARHGGGAILRQLEVPADYPVAGLNPVLADGDTMFDGRSDHYLSVGLSGLRIIEEALEGTTPRSILDLPCGFGRVTRVLRARFPKAAITVCDLDHEAVAFSAAQFGATGAPSVEDFRNLSLGRRFDLIWVGSLLTHLPEMATRRFLDFAVRHMHAGSRLVVTTHGAHMAARLRASTYGLSEDAASGLIAECRISGYAYRGYDGDPSYGVSLASRAWFEHVLDGSPLALQFYRPRGWDRHQDALALRLRKSSRVRRWLDRGRSFEVPAVSLAADSSKGVAWFDEDWYLAAYPDVAAAVAAGDAPSGLFHYRHYGWREGRGSCPPDATFEGRLRKTSRVEYADQAWSNDPVMDAEDSGQDWMAHPSVRARVFRLASGDPSRDAYDRLTSILEEMGRPVPIPRALSLGCGFGGLERDLYARGIATRMDACDFAQGAIKEACRLAEAAGMTGLRFHVGDLDRMGVEPSSVDVVFAHSSVHHAEQLEALYEAVHRTLRPGGLFHLNEFVGPTRFQWTDAQLEIANAFLDSLPGRLRTLPSGFPKERLRRPTIAEMVAADPTQAVRSSELVGLLAERFEIVETRPLGGAILHLALGGIAQNFGPGDEEILQALFALEDAAMADGRIGSDFAVIVARRP